MSYDLVVVGAGVAGLSVGRTMAREGWRVCVLDRRERIGTPVRCGEATGNRMELARFVPVDESWIAHDIRGMAVHHDEGEVVHREIPDTGVILHRDRFEQALARMGREHGMAIRLRTVVTGLVWDQSRCRGVVTAEGETVEGTYVVAADGAESRIGRWSGITEALKPREAFSAVQYSVRSDRFNDGFLHFFVGHRTIPRGYLWVFPKGEGKLSVGAGLFGIGGEVGEARSRLNAFMDTFFPDAQPGETITGCVPLALSPRELVRANLLVAGDAARQCNPLTAGGIMNALEAADLASRHLLRCGRDATTITALKGYSRRWHRGPRRQQKLFLLLKEVFLTLSPKELHSALTVGKRAFAGPIDRTAPFSLPPLRLLGLLRHLLPRAIRFASICWK